MRFFMPYWLLTEIIWLIGFLPDDHSRVKLKSDVNASKQDYINASFIVRNHQDHQAFYTSRNV